MDGIGAGQVHAHYPVGLAARPCGRSERIEGRSLLQGAEAALNCLVGQARNPQPAKRLFAAGMFVDQAKDVFALAPGVRSTDDALRLRAVEQFFDDLVLVGGRARRLELPLLGDHR